MKLLTLLLLGAVGQAAAQPGANTESPPVGCADDDCDDDGSSPQLDPDDPALDEDINQVTCEVDNCEACAEDNVCMSCSNGYGADEDGSCVSCTVDNCGICDNAIDGCQECTEGYVLETSEDATECTPCTITGCGFCQLDNEGVETCDTCATGYYQADDGSCTACPDDNCVQCADVDPNGNVGGCLTCADLYEAEVDGTCGLIGEDCGNNCADCEEHNQCKTCDSGYGLVTFNDGLSSGCQACPTNCATCIETDTCQECLDGFELDANSGSCATADQIVANNCDCRTTVNDGCNCVDEATAKDGCCDSGGLCSADSGGVCADYNNDVCTDFDNCAYCFDQSFCGACSDGYYKTSGHPWGACIAMPNGWDTELCAIDTLYNDVCDCGCGGVDPECAEHKADTCELSDDSGVFCDASGACATCDIDGCDYCNNGDDSDTCYECASGYDANDEGTCTKCDIDGCDSCQNSQVLDSSSGQMVDTVTCRLCMDGYYGNIVEGTCTACDAENCQECSSSMCNNCMDGYSLDSESGECNSCGDNCLQCGANVCNRCATDYEVQDGVCVLSGDCGDNCDTCQRGGQCKICEAGYYVGAGTNGKCVSCIDNCDSCRDGSSCTTCADGYDYDADEGGCVPEGECLGNVCDCRETTNSGCTCEEDEETAKLGCCNKDCGLCSDLCTDYAGEPCSDFANCEYCFGQSFCMECKDGFYQQEYAGDCVALPDNWDTSLDGCDITALSNNQCDCSCGGYDAECDDFAADGCDSGEYCSTDGECSECNLAGCAHCSNGEGHVDGSCLECTDGHYQDDDGNCVDCDLLGCATCLVEPGATSADNTYSCKECMDGYYMTTGDVCAECEAANCDACDLTGDCQECSAGYSLIDGACTQCSDNCLECLESECSRCEDGYELVEGECAMSENACGDNCVTCGAGGICKVCMDGFFRDDDSACSPCIDNCNDCSTDDTCSICVDNYGWDDASGKCSAYSDPFEYCADQIRLGNLDEGTECMCSGWYCADVDARVRLRR